MRIVVLTQDDPFFLPKAMPALKSGLPEGAEWVATVLFEVSPFGKRETFWQKTKKTFDVFGWEFFLYYTIKFIIAKLTPGNTLKHFHQQHNIPLIQLEGSINSKKNLEILAAYQPDLFVSIGGNQIFKNDLINLPIKGTINLHTALLPKYRGLMPSFWVLKNRERETGVSVFFVDEGIDSGPIIEQERVEIGNMSQEELIQKTKKIGIDLILNAIRKIKDDKVVLIPNPAEEMTYFSFPTKKDVQEFKQNGAKFFKWL